MIFIMEMTVIGFVASLLIAKTTDALANVVNIWPEDWG
ncbi:hypothetical protein ApDm4_2497 [Acetobacter pomorum]|nr:hypothetical protein ApDm4_2497 [Acetobacter pomorum]